MKAQVKEWFENKLAKEMGLPKIYSLEIFCGIKETEKAVYALFGTGYNANGSCSRKCAWVPKSCIENIESLTFIEDYDNAVRAFNAQH